MHNAEDSAILLVLVLVLEIRKTEDEEENEDEQRTVHIVKMVWAIRPDVGGEGASRVWYDGRRVRGLCGGRRGSIRLRRAVRALQTPPVSPV